MANLKIETIHTYHDLNGTPLYFKLRAKDRKTGEKFIRPLLIDDKGYLVNKTPPSKVLYNAHTLIKSSKEDSVWVVEGEACADMLSSYGLIATTSGDATSHSDVDWSLLSHKKVIIWPDNDEIGMKYAKSIINILSELNCNLYLINIDQLKLPVGGDCVDYVQRFKLLTRHHFNQMPMIKI